jgi:multidrug efflux pump subunit AcrA (membrane-fusion protein)
MEVVSQGRIDALIDVPERLVNLIGVGDTILVVIDALRLEAEGQIVSINPSGMSAARTFPVKVRLDDRGGLLKPGMSVTAMLPIGEQGERLTVPRDAVLYRGGAASVWVTTPSDEQTSLAAPIPVRALFGVGDRVAIEPVIASDASRLAEGTPVVVEGAERLSPGTPVTFGEGPATAENGGPPEQPEPTTGG